MSQASAPIHPSSSKLFAAVVSAEWQTVTDLLKQQVPFQAATATNSVFPALSKMRTNLTNKQVTEYAGLKTIEAILKHDASFQDYERWGKLLRHILPWDRLPYVRFVLTHNDFHLRLATDAVEKAKALKAIDADEPNAKMIHWLINDTAGYLEADRKHQLDLQQQQLQDSPPRYSRSPTLSQATTVAGSIGSRSPGDSPEGSHNGSPHSSPEHTPPGGAKVASLTDVPVLVIASKSQNPVERAVMEACADPDVLRVCPNGVSADQLKEMRAAASEDDQTIDKEMQQFYIYKGINPATQTAEEMAELRAIHRAGKAVVAWRRTLSMDMRVQLADAIVARDPAKFAAFQKFQADQASKGGAAAGAGVSGSGSMQHVVLDYNQMHGGGALKQAGAKQ